MNVTILKPCSVKLDGVVQSLSPDARLHLPDEKAQKLIDAGYAEQIKPDIEEYRRLTRELSERDPRDGCWDWIVKHRSEVWGDFIQAFMGGDMAKARQIFSDMIAAWEEHK
jgi:hypothetical protein